VVTYVGQADPILILIVFVAGLVIGFILGLFADQDVEP
jgi:F0F1-type ATP synthase assembly protein I